MDMEERWRDRQVGKEGGRETDQHRESSGKGGKGGKSVTRQGKRATERSVIGWEDRDS